MVVGTSPQFFCAVSAYLLSVIKRAPFVFEVRDIWPQSAVELGALKNPLIIRALESIEHFLYRRARLIIVVAEATRPYLLAKGVNPDKIRIVPNGIDAKYLESAVATSEEIRNQYDLNGKFIVSYIGTHGMSHALDVVLKAAGRLRDDTSVRFLFVGEGAEKENLKKLALELKLDNVIFVNEQSRERLLAFYRASDVSLVPLKRLDIFKKVLPSKLFELMGVGCPVICSVEGEAAELVKRSGGGECIEPENVDSLVESIRRLEKNKELRLQMSANGRTFVREFYLRSKLAENYLEALAVAAKLNGRNAAVNCAPGATGN